MPKSKITIQAITDKTGTPPSVAQIAATLRGQKDPAAIARMSADGISLLAKFLAETINAIRQSLAPTSVSIDGTEISSLVVGGRRGPGSLTVQMPPDDTLIGYIGSVLDSTSINIASALDQTFTLASAHGRVSGECVFHAGCTSLAHNGYFVIDSIVSATKYKVTSVITGASTGGTSKWNFVGAWLRALIIGASITSGQIVAKPDGSLTITNAVLTLTGNSTTTILNNDNDPASGDPISFMTYLTAGSAYPVEIGPGLVKILETTAVNLRAYLFANASSTQLRLLSPYGTAHQYEIRGTASTTNSISTWRKDGTPNVTITGDDGAINALLVNALLYQLGGTEIIDVSGHLKNLTGIQSHGTIQFDDVTANKPAKINNFHQLTGSTIDLTAASAEVSGTLELTNGGTGATTASGARGSLDVYSKAEVDALIAGLQTQINGKAASGGSTSSAGVPAHTHTI